MPSKRTGKRNVARDCNEALELLRLQQYTDKVMTTKNALEEIQELMQGQTILANFTSAHDHRTLKAAHSCLNSLRIRLEAHVNTVEQTVMQRQLSLISTIAHGCPQTTNAQAVPPSDSSVPPRFQISAHLGQPAHRSPQPEC